MRFAFCLSIIVSLALISLCSGSYWSHYGRGRRSLQRNVLNEELEACSFEPRTGWFRDGYCRTDRFDFGVHTVCAVMTDEFLEFTASRGNDLSTARGSFPGLGAGDRWCLCARRWLQAFRANKAPLVDIDATMAKTLRIANLTLLQQYNVDFNSV